MGELTIYDSQGKPFGTGGRADDRIEDFFFDGVRFALDMQLANEAVIFFRARDNETARSEQYYAVYKFQNRREIRRLGDEIRRVIEDEHGMILDTSQEDTEIFQYLVGDRSDEVSSLRPPGGPNLRDDLKTLLERSHNLRVGVDSYRSACGLFSEYFDDSMVGQLAIADSASSSRLEGYDLVVEVGTHQGLEPLGETADRLETLREQRRKRREAKMGGSSSSSGGPIGQIFDADTWAVDVAVAALVLIALASGGVFGACAAGVGPEGTLGKVPLLGNGCDSGGGGGSSAVELANASYDGASKAFVVTGTTNDENLTALNATFTVARNGTSLQKQTVLNVTDGRFTEVIANNETFAPAENQTYQITLNTTNAGSTTINVTINGSVDAGGATATPGSTATATPTPRPTATATATPTAQTTATSTKTQRATPTPSVTSTPSPTPTPTPSPTPNSTATQSTANGSTDSGSGSTGSQSNVGLSAGPAPSGANVVTVAAILGVIGLAAASLTTRRGE